VGLFARVDDTGDGFCFVGPTLPQKVPLENYKITGHTIE
jgi:hypothetical protein